MASTKGFSMAAFIEYGNGKLNNVSGKDMEIQTAFKTDLKKAIAHAGYPSKDEIGIIDEINDFDMSNTLEKIPEIVSDFMADTNRKFDLPAPDKKTCPATIYTQHVPEETKEGVSKLGGVEKKWTSTIAAHEVVKVKNHTKSFKK
jgi:hypothetical protein